MQLSSWLKALLFSGSIHLFGLGCILLLFFYYMPEKNSNYTIVDLLPAIESTNNPPPLTADNKKQDVPAIEKNQQEKQPLPNKIYDENTPYKPAPPQIDKFSDKYSPPKPDITNTPTKDRLENSNLEPSTNINDVDSQTDQQNDIQSDSDINLGNLEVAKPERSQLDIDPESFIPDNISKIMPNAAPDKTSYKALNYVLDDYNWSFETYVEQWARKIIDWWTIPSDYAAGLIPNGGSVWVSVKINNKGQLESFDTTKSMVSGEMETKAIQALISSFELPQLPQDFNETVTFHWQFIYPKYAPQFSPKKKR